jgi:hypothetical protein|tara:strand:+ start:1000 stop:1305 length:306 start_codon:yes stop_codon:yes gene_type:complete
MATYKQSSPYKATSMNPSGEHLGFYQIRTIPAQSDDATYTIEPQYHQRPDLLAYDMYDNPNLWWVFCQRNLDTMEDPIYDFKSGATIYVPKGGPLKSMLGV